MIIAETGKTDSTLLVFLYKSLDDSAVIKERPRYIARVDNSGTFMFRNLPPGNFALYAVKDEGGQRRYLSRNQLFAFADTPVVVNSTHTCNALRLCGKRYKFASTLRYHTCDKGAGAKVPQLQATTRRNQPGKRAVRPTDSFHLYFRAAPLKTFDTSKLLLTDEKFAPLSNYRFVQDTSGKEVTLFYQLAENTGYNLIFDKDFAEDTASRKLLRNDTLTFRTRKVSEYGLVLLRFPNLDLSSNPVLLFTQGDKMLIRMFLPLRILCEDLPAR